jgi:divalent metal cation (Fe/Co/Zn/Cd) transporter
MERIAVKYSTIRRLFRLAVVLTVFTIAYNLTVGIVSINFGFDEKTLALFGLGINNFVEIVPTFWVLARIIRGKSTTVSHTHFERAALQIAAVSFYILAVGIIGAAIFILYSGHKPQSTISGVVISMISLATMSALLYGESKVGMRLRSEVIIAKANRAKDCIYMSVVLFVSSAIYEATELLYIDSIGALGIAYFSFRKGKDCFKKIRSNQFNALQ